MDVRANDRGSGATGLRRKSSCADLPLTVRKNVMLPRLTTSENAQKPLLNVCGGRRILRVLRMVTMRYAFSGNGARQHDASGSDCGDAMKIFNETSESIREINLSYITLAQRLLQEDRAVGMLRLGLSKEVADILVNLTLAQVVKFAASNHLLCSFRFNDHAMLSALTKSSNRADVVPACTAVSMPEQQAVQSA